jgi:hypothetical protein
MDDADSGVGSTGSEERDQGRSANEGVCHVPPDEEVNQTPAIQRKQCPPKERGSAASRCSPDPGSVAEPTSDKPRSVNCADADLDIGRTTSRRPGTTISRQPPVLLAETPLPRSDSHKEKGHCQPRPMREQRWSERPTRSEAFTEERSNAADKRA